LGYVNDPDPECELFFGHSEEWTREAASVQSPDLEAASADVGVNVRSRKAREQISAALDSLIPELQPFARALVDLAGRAGLMPQVSKKLGPNLVVS
jgi:hypothetical protein